ncbi:CBN-ZTF-1 protein [Caenorhabditis brenneri]|uniref:CBN-ZTF-1 protein n=1 Tax=Caenorhabditis brenneri TaxID=135651 RepID=G0NB67_CAEBE|nr:CBN-ZTF-1 protein [Caenorhabditis brenneri]
MSETFELNDNRPTTSATHSLISENGKKYYYINVQSQNSSIADSGGASSSQEVTLPDQQHQQEPENQVVENEGVQPLEKSGPLHYFGENMVVKNAREMFNNVDILPDGRYYCCVCNRPYKTHATLTAHLRGSHLRQESPCLEPDCNHISYTENERKKHQKIHDKKKYSNISREAMMTFLGWHSQVKMCCAIRLFGIADKCQGPYLRCESLKQCFYCGEVKNGTMDLHIHYLRCHKNEGIRTITCKACGRGFTTTALFRNHPNRTECELASQNMLVRQDIYYGELPDGTLMDHLTMNRMNFFRKRQEQRAAESALLERQIDTNTDVEAGDTETVINGTKKPCSDEIGCSSSNDLDYSDDIFNGSNSLIQTEFGLKTLDEYKTTRVTKRVALTDEDPQLNIKRERVLIAQNKGYCHQYDPNPQQSEQQLQNDAYPSNYVFSPPAYGYDPLIGRYPDFQPMQQLQYAYYNDSGANSSYYSEHFQGSSQDQNQVQIEEQNRQLKDVKAEENTTNVQTGFPETSQVSDPIESTSDIASDLLVNDEQDVVFEELDKLDFVMPTNEPTDDNDDDLEAMFNF